MLLFAGAQMQADIVSASVHLLGAWMPRPAAATLPSTAEASQHNKSGRVPVPRELLAVPSDPGWHGRLTRAVSAPDQPTAVHTRATLAASATPTTPAAPDAPDAPGVRTPAEADSGSGAKASFKVVLALEYADGECARWPASILQVFVRNVFACVWPFVSAVLLWFARFVWRSVWPFQKEDKK